MSATTTGANVLLERIRALCANLSLQPVDESVELESLPGVKAVLFNICGTLFYGGSDDAAPESFRRETLVEALKEAGFAGDLETAAGLGKDWLQTAVKTACQERREQGVEAPAVDLRPLWRGVLARLHAENLLDREAEEADALRVAVEYEFRVNPAAPMPGMLEALAGLAERGIRLGIIANTQFHTPMLFQALLNKTPQQLGFDRRLCIYSHDAGEAKTSPWLFEKALAVLRDRWGIHPTETLCIGSDLKNDLLPADATGCWSVLFAGDARLYRKRAGDPHCSHLHPDCIITSLDQIPACIEG